MHARLLAALRGKISSSARRLARDAFVATLCCLVIAACETSSSRKAKDGLGRTWKIDGTYDTSTKHLRIEAKLADGTPAERLTLVEYNSAGTMVGATSVTNGGPFDGTLNPNTASITLLAEAGGAGTIVHEVLAQ